MRTFLSVLCFCFAILLTLAACGRASSPAGTGGRLDPVSTEAVPLRTPVPPTVTAVLSPDYKTPSPIPPEHQEFFIDMVDGSNGVPAIQPSATLSNTNAPGITREDVEQYVKSHQMRGDMVSISYDSLESTIVSIELVPLVDVYRLYMSAASIDDWQGPYPPDTQVYVVELHGSFRFSGGPYPGNRGTYETGIWVFDAKTGYDILEGGVGRTDNLVLGTPGR